MLCMLCAVCTVLLAALAIPSPKARRPIGGKKVRYVFKQNVWPMPCRYGVMADHFVFFLYMIRHLL